MKNINIYLHFNGKSEQAFLFYKTIFGGEFITVQRFKDVAGSEKINPGDLEKIMHISLQINPITLLMATDNLSNNYSDLNQGNNFHICIQAQSEKEADKLFHELSKDGKIEMPMNKTFWGAYFGMCCDQFGIQWMINYTDQQNKL